MQAFFARLLAKGILGELTPGMGRFRSFFLDDLEALLRQRVGRLTGAKARRL